jgi:hypothetical protein
MQYSTNAAKLNAAKLNAAQRSAAQRSAAYCSWKNFAAFCSTAECCTAQLNAAQHIPAPAVLNNWRRSSMQRDWARARNLKRIQGRLLYDKHIPMEVLPQLAGLSMSALPTFTSSMARLTWPLKQASLNSLFVDGYGLVQGGSERKRGEKEGQKETKGGQSWRRRRKAGGEGDIRSLLGP